MEQYGFRKSMSRPGTPSANQPIESFWQTLKRERPDIWPLPFEEAKRVVVEYIELYYNASRLPNLTLPADDERPGVREQHRLNYLKQHHKVLYYNLFTSGKLHSHLADINWRAEELFSWLVKEYAEK